MLSVFLIHIASLMSLPACRCSPCEVYAIILNIVYFNYFASVQVTDGEFPATNQTFNIGVEPLRLSFASSSSSLTLVQGDRLVVVDDACLPLVTNGRLDVVVYRVKQSPTRGQLLHRGTHAVDEFTQRQVR